MFVTAPERTAHITLKLHTLERLVTIAWGWYHDLNDTAIASASTPAELYHALCEARNELARQRDASGLRTALRDRLTNRFFYLTKFIHCNFDGMV